jgi:hypothetical protein
MTRKLVHASRISGMAPSRKFDRGHMLPHTLILRLLYYHRHQRVFYVLVGSFRFPLLATCFGFVFCVYTFYYTSLLISESDTGFIPL